ncbi:MAG: MFS transporter [Pirellulales bacterium]|nr:MFS transporter [Pirellulales bacterium]
MKKWPRRPAESKLLGFLLVATVGVAFSDVVVDALMVEKGQRHAATGLFQSIQWACIYSATVLTGLVGGLLSGSGQQQLGFLICATAAAITLFLATVFVREDRHSLARPRLRGTVAALVQAVRTPGILAVGGFIFLWNFNPFSNDVLYLHMTGQMRLTEQFYGSTVSLMAVSSVVASAAYGFYCRRIPMVRLIHASIVLGILSTLGYWAMVDKTSAVVVTLAIGFTYMTALLIQLDLAAQACPAEVAGTGFALLMALSNLSMSLSTALGGHLYDRWAASWGATAAFHHLVGCGAAFTAACWLLVPVLRRTITANPGTETEEPP